MVQNLTKGRPFSILLTFTLPVIGGNLFQLFYTLADSVIVGRTLGTDALAAVGATSMVVYLVLCFIQGFTSGFGIRLGQLYGAGKTRQMETCVAVSWILSVLFTIFITILCCLLSHQILFWVKTPDNIYDMAYDYMFAILLGTGATVFYNLISNLLRALGDSRTPLIFLVFSSLLNIVLDLVFILPFGMGIAGAAWATVLSQLISAVLCTISGMRHFSVLRPSKGCLSPIFSEASALLRLGFPIGFQMSVMCIGQLAMQAAVNALGSDAIAGYTAATKADQVSVLINNAFGIAISNFTAQNYGARLGTRIRQGVRASLIQTEAANLLMCGLILLFKDLVPALFVEAPTSAIMAYSNGYLTTVAPFYLLLGLLLVVRSTVQSMGNGTAPFAACIVELIMRIGGTFGLASLIGYTGICLASPLAWLGAVALLVPVYAYERRKLPE